MSEVPCRVRQNVEIYWSPWGSWLATARFDDGEVDVRVLVDRGRSAYAASTQNAAVREAQSYEGGGLREKGKPQTHTYSYQGLQDSEENKGKTLRNDALGTSPQRLLLGAQIWVAIIVLQVGLGASDDHFPRLGTSDDHFPRPCS